MNRGDKELAEIAQILVGMFEDQDECWAPEFKLWTIFGMPHRNIYKRRVLERIKVHGAFWMESVEGEISQRKLDWRTLQPRSFVYIREDLRALDEITIEMNVETNKGNIWKTADISRAELNRISAVLGPKTEVCECANASY